MTHNLWQIKYQKVWICTGYWKENTVTVSQNMNFYMGKEEAPFVDTDINFIVNILTRAMTSSPYCVIMTSFICSIWRTVRWLDRVIIYGLCSGWKFGEKSSRFIESKKWLNFLPHFLSMCRTIYQSTAFKPSTKVKALPFWSHFGFYKKWVIFMSH